ncbi:RHS repeat-associated protein [Pantoea alhagi]|uniref:RHS repeat-associated core domain-containing protein n=1 Tax=Mixta sp. BE291 TaxID=3158787 RepID=UPI002861DB97|nr:RHS repeat-associated protein [Pantoea alhagi]
MADEFIAARMDDPLVHSSALADFASGLVEGAIYLGIYAAATAVSATGIGAAVGIALTVGAMVSGIPEQIGNKAGEWVDSALDFFGLKGPPDAKITSGSDNVHIMGKPAARAAGTVDHDFLNSPAAEQDDSLTAKDVVMMVAAGISATASAVLHPGKTAQALAEGISHIDGDDVKNHFINIWKNLTQPMVASASPYATPAPKDTVLCSKNHLAENVNFLAEGSRKVLINGQPAARNGDRSTCEAKIEVAENPRVRIGGGSIVVRDIRSGKNAPMYMLGGLMGSGLREGMRLLQSIYKEIKFVRMLRNAACPLAAAGAQAAATEGAVEAAGLIASKAVQTAHPVNIATGAKILAGQEDLDFSLADRIPLLWQRVYHSRNTTTGLLGTGWMLPFETRLLQRVNGANSLFFWRDVTGRELVIGAMNPGDVVHCQEDGMTLWYSAQGSIVLQSDLGEFQLYEPDPQRAGEWRITRICDRHENCQHYAYNDAGQLVSISGDNEALTVALSYESQHGRLAAVHQVCGGEHYLLVGYRYNDRGQLIAVEDADGIVTRRFGWDAASDRMGSHSYATGLCVDYEWRPEAGGAEWRVAEYRVRDEQQNVLEHWLIDADEQARTATVTCLSGGSTQHHWDHLYRITRYTDSYGNEWHYRWTPDGELLKATVDPDGHRWEYNHDARGNLTMVRDPLGQATLTTWHEVYAFPLKEVLPDGAVWQYGYNNHGDVTELTDPLGGVTRFVWNDQGDLIERIDALQNTSRYWWDERGQLLREEDCSGHQSHRIYDDCGRLIRLSQPGAGSEQWQWTAAGRLAAHMRADGRETRYDYDRAGLLTGSNTDGFSERRVTRNARGQVVTETDPAGHQVGYRYDRFGRLQTLINPNGDRWRFEYDNGERLLAQYDWAGRRTAYRYTQQGQVAEVTRASLTEGEAAQRQRYGYDALGRVVTKQTADSHTEYFYGAREVKIRRTTLRAWQQATAGGEEPQWEETLSFSRDAAGNLTAEENHGGRWQHAYDALGNLRVTTAPDGSALHHLRYGSGHLLQMNLRHGDGNTELAGYERDSLHREIRRSQGALTLETRYDAAGRITLRGSRRGQALIFERRYRWDRLDQIIQESVTDSDAGKEKYRQQLWGYDAAGRVTRSVGPAQEARFSWDAAGNRTEAPGQRVWHNLLQRLNGIRLAYDGFGRLAERHDTRHGVTQRFRWDEENRLTVAELEGHREYRRAEYRYDLLGRRTHKLLYRHDRAEPEVTTFQWNGLRLAGEESSGAPGRKTQYVYSEGTWEPLARVDSSAAGSEVYWYQTALNGLPERMTDSQGDTVWQGTFSTWGETQREQSHAPLAVAQNLRFQGQYLDRETGLHYNLFRYYDPATGRYTQPDPIGLAGGLNTYAYVGDPLVWVDPLGWCSTKLGRNMGARPRDGMANHHLIPEELIKDPRYRSVFGRLKNIGWDGDGASNGIFLPGGQELSKILSLPGHWSSHAEYTGDIRVKLDVLARQAGRMSDTQLALKVKNIQDWAREGLEKGLFKVDANNGRLI